MIKRVLIIAASTLSLTIGFSLAIAQAPVDPVPETSMTEDQTAAIARGAKAWASTCSQCHNLRSPSELEPDIWKISVMHMRTRANIPGSIADDIKLFLMSSTMNGSIAVQQIEKSAKFDHLKPGNPLVGETVYFETCVACHGDTGKGDIEGVPDLTDKNGRLARSDDFVLSNIIYGVQSDGSFMAMPPMGGNPELSEQDMADVLAYLRDTVNVKAVP